MGSIPSIPQNALHHQIVNWDDHKTLHKAEKKLKTYLINTWNKILNCCLPVSNHSINRQYKHAWNASDVQTSPTEHVEMVLQESKPYFVLIVITLTSQITFTK